MPDTTRLTTALGDRYLIERELGSGGMATVYLAKDLKHERDVALKVLRPELGAVLGPDRFLAEIKITARLDHPHILTLIDSGASDGFLYYVLPYVRGESLRDKLNRDKQLGIDEALAITRQIASALDYAHRQGVVHRDIKPENILLQEGEAMLADFGIALAVKEAGGNRLTETGLSLGTPQYMSPEQATGDRTLDARSDVYSLAAVLYEMLAGEPPVTGPTVQAVIAKLITERPSRIRVVRDTVPEGVDNAVARALAKVPADRFASAGEFAASLTNTGAPGHGGTGAPRRSMARFGIAAAGVLALVVIAALLVRGRGAVRVIQPDRVQVTFTGTARTPALSPDGQRLAYSERHCAADGYCTFDLVVQDVGGAGTSTVLHGWASVWGIEWTADSRYLLVNGYERPAGHWGPFSVPSLGGGPARFLGCCWASLGIGDTALVAGGVSGDSLFWLKFVTMADGIARDSLPVRRTPGTVLSVSQFPGGRRTLAVRRSRTGGGETVFVMERDGRVIDSLRIDDPHYTTEGLSADGRAVIASEANLAGTTYDLVARAISADGRLARSVDTVLRQVSGNFSLARNGMLANASGSTDYEVWLLRRDGPGSMHFAQRRLAAGTAQVGGLPAPDGGRLALLRRVVQGDRALAQLSVMPIDSGPETLLGPPLDVADYEWSADGSGLIVAVGRGSDTVDIRAMDVPSTRTRALLSVPRHDFGALVAVPGGGMLVAGASAMDVRVVGVPWRRDTVFSFPEAEGHILETMPSPDGRDIVLVGWDRNDDSVVVRRMSLADGRTTHLAAFYADGLQRPQWLPDGTILMPIRETGSTLVWYRIPASGGRPVRLGTPPRSADANFRMTRDGRFVVARVASAKSDIYLVRNFAELLKH